MSTSGGASSTSWRVSSSGSSGRMTARRNSPCLFFQCVPLSPYQALRSGLAGHLPRVFSLSIRATALSCHGEVGSAA